MIEIPKSVGEISRNSTACDVGEITNEEADLDLKKFKEEIVETCNKEQTKIEQQPKKPKKSKVPEPKKSIPKPSKIPEPKVPAQPPKPDPEEPRDVIREYVLQEEEKIAKRRSKMPLKFKDLKPVCVARNRAKLSQKREKLQRSWSTNRLPTESTKNSNVSKMANFSRHSIERLPTLSAFDEERIVWLKNFEDEVTMEEERRLKQAENITTSESSASSPSTCISRGSSPYNKLRKSRSQIDALNHELSVNTTGEINLGTSTETENDEINRKLPRRAANKKNRYEIKIAKSKWYNANIFYREMAEERRRSKSRKKINAPLNAECFMVSRGWQLDQTRLLRSLDRLKNANFGRVQLATTINRVVENIRPHLDAVLIHIGNQELIEAAYSVVSVTENGENVKNTAAVGLSVAGSVATVMSRHIITAANQNRATQFIISLPLPVSLAKTNLEADIHYTELRRMFNATMKANCTNCPNIQCCENENLTSVTGKF